MSRRTSVQLRDQLANLGEDNFNCEESERIQDVSKWIQCENISDSVFEYKQGI